jgi:hypothetical protein
MWSRFLSDSDDRDIHAYLESIQGPTNKVTDIPALKHRNEGPKYSQGSAEPDAALSNHVDNGEGVGRIERLANKPTS